MKHITHLYFQTPHSHCCISPAAARPPPRQHASCNLSLAPSATSATAPAAQNSNDASSSTVRRTVVGRGGPTRHSDVGQPYVLATFTASEAATDATAVWTVALGAEAVNALAPVGRDESRGKVQQDAVMYTLAAVAAALGLGITLLIAKKIRLL